MTEHRIAVCVDGSESSVPALTWAVAEARRRHVPLTIAHVAGHHRFALHHRHDEERLCADDLLTCDLVEGVETEVATVAGSSTAELFEAVGEAEMLVIAGPHGLAGALAVSFSRRVAVRATVPVVVVRGQCLSGRRPVAVGVTDRSEDEVLRTAFEEASSRACALLAVRAFVSAAIPFRLPGEEGDDIDTEQAEQQERMCLDRLLAPWRARYPGVPVEYRLAHRSAGTALTSASRQAQLVVVGSHGHNMLVSSLTGSPVPELLRRSSCPVLLARR